MSHWQRTDAVYYLLNERPLGQWHTTHTVLVRTLQRSRRVVRLTQLAPTLSICLSMLLIIQCKQGGSNQHAHTQSSNLSLCVDV
jgi:hypothetical protein